MKVNLAELKLLVSQGLVEAHNSGPPPELVVRLFKTKPAIWSANLQEYKTGNKTEYSIPMIAAHEGTVEHVQDSDLKNTIEILGDYFYLADAMKIQGGEQFDRPYHNRPPMIFLWWD